MAMALVLVAVIATLGGASLGVAGTSAAGATGEGVSVLAQREIPSTYLRLYQQAARRYGLDWAILAGIGKVECDHGRAPDPACNAEGAVNTAGAGGPMQFIASTWAAYGVDADGDGRKDRWNPADAIYAAGSYLRASGAPSDYRHAILAYNHAGWYADEVESWAARYRGATSTQGALAGAESGAGADVSLARKTLTPVRFIAGGRARLAPADGHVALIPAGVPAAVQGMLVAGNELQDLPYGPGGHPDPRGALEEDCSSTINYVLYRAGIRAVGEILAQNPLAQDYMSWGAPGPGRWVTIYAADAPTPHAFLVIAGLRLDTSHNGTDTGPNRGEDGPRWRMLDRIPTWAHWSVRHPPAL
ncbi:MAG TPA: lytic transglycosylase domain-containing protein [Solirubrobacteraceae bacterium]|nr:lytic transglycosylase domain-containing protein [Solirubrobacteraceae bacterium]